MTADILLDEITPTNQSIIMDRARWFNLHRCDTQIVTLADGRKKLAIRVPMTCVNLDQDKNGQYICKDYDNRPQLCKDFLCERARAIK